MISSEDHKQPMDDDKPLMLKELEKSSEALFPHTSLVDSDAYYFLKTLHRILTDGLRWGASLDGLITELSPPDTLEHLHALEKKYELFKHQNEREMAWIMTTLNEGLLSCYLRILVDNPDLMSKYYQATSVFTSQSTAIIQMIDTLLDSKSFALDHEQYLLFRLEIDTKEEEERERKARQELLLKSPMILSRRSPEPVKGLGDALLLSPLGKSLNEFKLISAAGDQAPTKEAKPIVLELLSEEDDDKSGKEIDNDNIAHSPCPTQSTLVLTDPATMTIDKSQSSTSLTDQIVFNGFLSTRTFTPDQPCKAPLDLGLVNQRFMCSSCTNSITADTGERCLRCGLYKCPDCFDDASFDILIEHQVVLNWDFTLYRCCNACLQGAPSPDTLFLNITDILPFALEHDHQFRRGWLRHTTALPVAMSMCDACLSAPDPTCAWINSPGQARLSDLYMMHRVGSDPVSDVFEMHLKRCTEGCGGRNSGLVCAVCQEGDPIMPLARDSDDSWFCPKCKSAWHKTCETMSCPNGCA